MPHAVIDPDILSNRNSQYSKRHTRKKMSDSMENDMIGFLPEPDLNEGSLFRARNITLDPGELILRSLAFGRMLREAGLKEGGLVCLAMEKSLDFTVAFLGVNRTGGICLPIPPDAPREMLHCLLYHLDARWLIADRHASGLIDDGSVPDAGINLGWMDDCRHIPEGTRPEFVRDNLKYYTDGAELPGPDPERTAWIHLRSFEEEKMSALVLSNRELGLFVDSLIAHLNPKSGDRIAGFAPADSLFWPLEAVLPFRGTVTLLQESPSLLKHPRRLIPWLRRHKITTAFLNSDDLDAPMLNSLESGQEYGGLQRLIFWGKSRGNYVDDSLRSRFPGCTMFHIYSVNGSRDYRSTGRKKAEPPVSGNAAGGSEVPCSGSLKEPFYLLSKRHMNSGRREIGLLPKLREVHKARWRKRVWKTVTWPSASEYASGPGNSLDGMENGGS